MGNVKRCNVKRFANHDDTILDMEGSQLISTDEIVDKLNELDHRVKYWKSVGLRDKKLSNPILIRCPDYKPVSGKRFELAFDNEDWWGVYDNFNYKDETWFSGQEVVDLLNDYDEKYLELKGRVIDSEALVIMLANTTVSGRVDNVIFNRYSFKDEGEYYLELERIKTVLSDAFMDDF